MLDEHWWAAIIVGCALLFLVLLDRGFSAFKLTK